MIQKVMRLKYFDKPDYEDILSTLKSYLKKKYSLLPE
eukprot:CAMPEP_0170550522 /NCGR_PEP_ID=MMETSP0211-20121228/8581_1 /TAXON_ID=311385 /ORGANISM="Pseudokeronopsis sp., Strain OXSARD2" /LENGTH=36 /DNA_ID= /DNA_START= /DNA_END= /DNA_ORIENTATION=